jgi:hypothetical protein
MPGFTSPGLFFIGTVVPKEMWYLKRVFEGARDAGYTRFVEPAAGAFAMCGIARTVGWRPEQMDATDVALLSAILGHAANGEGVGALEIQIKDPEVEGLGLDLGDPAQALYAQMLCRYFVKAARTMYWREIVTDLITRKDAVLKDLTAQLGRLTATLKGFRYRPLCMYAHLAEVLEDPQTFVSLNPPTHCLAPDHRILTADLRWVRCGQLKVGERILAFNENPGVHRQTQRRFEVATILRSEPEIEECVRVTLADGRSIICTADHPWLAQPQTKSDSKRQWVEARHLANRTRGRIAGRPPWYVLQQFEPWEDDRSYEAGWLAGILDGEGSVGYHECVRACVTQACGPVAEQIASRFLQLGIKATTRLRQPNSRHHKPLVSIDIAGGTAQVLSALGRLRPSRLLEQYQCDIHRVAIQAKPVIVKSVEPIGPRPIQSITTTSKTYIGEGFLMHNCGGWERFYNTGGRLTWREPTYAFFNPHTDMVKLAAMIREAKALVLLYEEVGFGQSVLPAVFARGGAMKDKHDTGGVRSMATYLSSNRPDEIEALAAGRKIARREPENLRPTNLPILPPTYEPIDASRVALVSLDAGQSAYYRQLWTHRFLGAVTPMNGLGLVLDGYLAGIFAYTRLGLDMGAFGKVAKEDALLLQCGVTPRLEGWRLGRLVTKLALSRAVLAQFLDDVALVRVTHIFTMQFTKYPEAKEMRGLMKLQVRQPFTNKWGLKKGFKLRYQAPIEATTMEEAYAWWIKDERRYRSLKQPSMSSVT